MGDHEEISEYKLKLGFIFSFQGEYTIVGSPVSNVCGAIFGKLHYALSSTCR